MTGTMIDIYLGRIVKAFGIRGELKFHPAPDFWSQALQSKKLRLGMIEDGDVTEREIGVTRSRPHGNSFVIAIDGVDDRTRAEALVGAELFLAEDDIDVEMPEYPLPFQLIGLAVKNEDGEMLGELTSIVQSGAHDVYEVKGDHGEFLVPAVPEFVISIDLDEGVMVMRPIPGLIEDEA